MIDPNIVAVILLFFAAFGAFALKKNIMKAVMAVTVLTQSALFMLVSMKGRGYAVSEGIAVRAVLISFIVLLVLLFFVHRIYKNYGSLDARKRRLKG